MAQTLAEQNKQLALKAFDAVRRSMAVRSNKKGERGMP